MQWGDFKELVLHIRGKDHYDPVQMRTDRTRTEWNFPKCFHMVMDRYEVLTPLSLEIKLPELIFKFSHLYALTALLSGTLELPHVQAPQSGKERFNKLFTRRLNRSVCSILRFTLKDRPPFRTKRRGSGLLRLNTCKKFFCFLEQCHIAPFHSVAFPCERGLGLQIS